MSDKQIKAYLNIILCLLAGIMLTIIGIIAGLVKITNKVEEYEQRNLQVHEYIFNRIETK
jgi:hypothetical protein